jgi:hypothetical protein
MFADIEACTGVTLPTDFDDTLQRRIAEAFNTGIMATNSRHAHEQNLCGVEQHTRTPAALAVTRQAPAPLRSACHLAADPGRPR